MLTRFLTALLYLLPKFVENTLRPRLVDMERLERVRDVGGVQDRVRADRLVLILRIEFYREERVSH